MQNAKDSFYEALRARLTTLNPERTVVVRGVTRPGVVVDENETQSIEGMTDCFHLSWTAMTFTREGLLPLVTLTCVIRYGTAGTSMNGGLDRGRALASMDGELLAAVGTWPQNACKNDYSGLALNGTVKAMGSRVWWSDPTFSPVEVQANQISRSAVVQVMSYQEAGEL